MDYPHYPGSHYKGNTHFGAHDGQVVERLTDCSIPVICHVYEQHHLTSTHNANKKYLYHALWKRNDVAFSEKIRDNLGTVVEDRPRSSRERLVNKKYMGVCK